MGIVEGEPRNGGFNHVICDYQTYRAQARKWARYALQNKRDGLPWQECARNAHENFSWALKIIS